MSYTMCIGRYLLHLFKILIIWRAYMILNLHEFRTLNYCFTACSRNKSNTSTAIALRSKLSHW